MKALACIKKTLDADFLSLSNMQELLGRLNDICQMCGFMRGFVHPLYENLSAIAKNPTANICMDSQGVKDLQIWINFLTSEEEWLPIQRCYYSPPLACISFSSDAGGGTNELDESDALGCGSVGFSHIGTIIFACQIFWPDKVLQYTSDTKGSSLGNKTTTLEFLGILLPFILILSTIYTCSNTDTIMN